MAVYEFLKSVGAGIVAYYICKWLDGLLSKISGD